MTWDAEAAPGACCAGLHRVGLRASTRLLPPRGRLPVSDCVGREASFMRMSKLQASDFKLPREFFDEVLWCAVRYYREAMKCRDSKAFHAACVMVAAAFESLLLAFVDCYAEEAAALAAAPRRGKVIKPLRAWTLANLLAVAKERNWLPAGLSPDDAWDDAKAKVGDYCEVIRQIRNLIHPLRYVADSPRTRITKRYFESVFLIFAVASDYLQDKIEDSIRH